jgi:hypothetical protein
LVEKAAKVDDSDTEELRQLEREMDVSSLGDKPYSIAASKLRRLIELEWRQRDEDQRRKEQPDATNDND